MRGRGLITAAMLALLAGARAFPAEGRFHEAPLKAYLDGEFASDLSFRPSGKPAQAGERITLKGIPFALSLDKAGNWRSVDVGPSRWREMQKDPLRITDPLWTHSSAKEGDLVLHLPEAPYVRAHVLAASDGLAGREPVLTLRCGVFQRIGFLADAMVAVPAFQANPGTGGLHSVPGQVVAKKGTRRPGRLFVVPVLLPMGDLLKVIGPINDTARWPPRKIDTFDVQLTRRLHVRVAAPDPAMFEVLPLGLPSGARVFGITFERSPVALRIEGQSTWNVFPHGRDVAFKLRVENLTVERRTLELSARWQQRLMAKPTARSWKLSLAPRETRTITHKPECRTHGKYDYTVTLKDSAIGPLFVHRTWFARLPEFAEAPLEKGLRSRFGVWWWDGTHRTQPGGAGVDVMDWMGLGYVHRFYGHPPKALEPARKRGLRIYFDDAVLCFHEKYISGKHLMHYPRRFLGEPRYTFDEKELKRRQELHDSGVELCEKTRKEHPERTIIFGNSSFNFVEEMLHMRFPAELIDLVGHECPGFARMPERQPELAALHTAYWYKQTLREEGYDKPMASCSEWLYRSTNPGNLSQQEQADLYVRDLLHGLAYKFTRVTPACLEDVGNGYYFSNWGASGLFTRLPDVHPKLAYVAYAVAAHKLSDADFVRAVPTGSHSVYCLEFDRRRGDRLFACWTLRGRRRMTLRGKLSGLLRSNVFLTEQEGNQSRLRPRRGIVSFEVSPSPVFIEGVKTCREAQLGPPEYAERPATKRGLLKKLEGLDAWRLVGEPEDVLDNGNFDYPRQKGTFEVRVVEDEARGKCLEFALKASGSRPPYVPSYQAIRLEKPVAIPGKPTAVGLFVRGNSGWGRIHFDLCDANGERWLSIGMPAWNTNDNESLSYVIFDGWRWMQIPLPGHYPSGYHWPRQCNWRNGTPDKTGDGVVDYPLQLVGLVLEQREQIVYVNKMVKASRQPVRLRDLAVLYGDPERVGDWETWTQQEDLP